MPVVDRAAPPPVSPPLRAAVDDLAPLPPPLGPRWVACSRCRGPGLCGRTAETACPSSEPESAGRGRGANPIKLAQRAATHPASAMPKASFPARTARSRRVPFATKTGSPSAGASGSTVVADIDAFLLTVITACPAMPRIRLKHIPQFRPSRGPASSGQISQRRRVEVPSFAAEGSRVALQSWDGRFTCHSKRAGGGPHRHW